MSRSTGCGRRGSKIRDKRGESNDIVIGQVGVILTVKPLAKRENAGLPPVCVHLCFESYLSYGAPSVFSLYLRTPRINWRSL